jgi:predicted transcriptional regulator
MVKQQKSNIILKSIKPIFAEQIRDGTKTIEIGKNIPSTIEKIVVYESRPIQKITMILSINRNIRKKMSQFIKSDYEDAKVDSNFLESYCNHTDRNLDLVFINSVQIVDINPNKIFERFTPPQNFMYLTNDQLNLIQETDAGKEDEPEFHEIESEDLDDYDDHNDEDYDPDLDIDYEQYWWIR